MKSHPTRSRFFRESSCNVAARRKWLLLAAIALITLPSTGLVNAGGVLYFVNTTSDTVVIGACETGGAGCSLRGAIGAANNHAGEDGIEINLGPGSVINLTSALPAITDSVSIFGPGASALAVRRGDTGGSYRIFTVTTSGAVTFSGLTISNGEAPSGGSGGGIQNASTGTVNITNCTLSSNTSFNSGGGIDNFGTVNITNCTLSGNTSSFFGGGAISNNGTLNLINSTLSGNYDYRGGSGSARGGGIFNSNLGIVNVINSTLSGNAAYGGFGDSDFGDGGGISNGGTLTVTNSTLSGNTASGIGGNSAGGGIANNGGTVNIRSSIIALNTAYFGPDLSGTFASQGFNLIGENDGAAASFPAGNPNANNDIVGTDLSPIDPKLDPNGLQNNGGPTQTIALLVGSPAIDKGTSAGLTGNLTTDQRGTGFARKVDYSSVANAAGGDGTDVGAFELGFSPVPLVSVVSRKVHGATPFDINLPLTGNPGIECRSGGASGVYKLIFSFANNLTSVGNASVTSGTGSVSSKMIGANAHNYIVNLTGVSNAQVIRVRLTNVNDSAGNHSSSVPISMGVLIGDTTGNGTVNSSDVSQTKSKSGQTVNASNFRTDVTVSNSINSSDVSLVKSKSGTALP